MDQLAAGRRRGAGQIVHFTQGHLQAAAGGVPRNAGAIDAATDDKQIVNVGFRQNTPPRVKMPKPGPLPGMGQGAYNPS